MNLNLKDLIGIASLIITLIALHRSNVTRIQSMETKLDIMYEWFKSEKLR